MRINNKHNVLAAYFTDFVCDYIKLMPKNMAIIKVFENYKNDKLNFEMYTVDYCINSAVSVLKNKKEYHGNGENNIREYVTSVYNSTTYTTRV
jgi:hypothetical protein